MATSIALLRAVNVGGRSRLVMSDLRELAGAIGLRNVRTLLQTGNLVFEADGADHASLEATLEAAMRERLGVDTDFMVRPAEALSAAIAGNPFPDEAKRDPAHLLLIALKAPPPAANAEALRAAITGRERIELRGDWLYAVYPDGIGRSKLTPPLIERKLGTRGTGRNWNTVLKLIEMAGS